jgi:triosephosphate isomerase
MRKKIVAGNWKMNMDLTEGLNFAKSVDKHFRENPPAKAEVILCPPFIHLAGIAEIIKGGNVKLGAQNCASEASGAYTGEVSAYMVKSTGAEYVIIGHSERRSYYHEDDKLLNKKTQLALNADLKVIFCVGEVKSEREEGKHLIIVKRQMEEGLFNLSREQMANIIVAYEPVWAIGTGLTASPEQAQEIHKYIRDLVKEKYGNETANNLTILYGGSCKPSNAAELFSKPDVDGGLIGGASLKKEDFAGIVKAI